MSKKSADRAVVSFGADGVATSFHVYLPDQASLANVAGILRAVMADPANRAATNGQLAADFVAACNPAVRCRLVPGGPHLADIQLEADHRVFVTQAARRATISVHKLTNGAVGRQLFSGTVEELSAWVQARTGLDHLVQKVVQFKYDGGSKPGAVRTVRVEDVERDANGHVSVCGYDLEKPDLKHGYRKYLRDRIAGDITVLN